MSSDPETLRRFAEDYTAAWCSLDPSRVAAHYALDGSLAINGGAPAVGRDAITATARGFYAALPDMQVLMGDLVIDGDRIESHWTFTGRTRGRAAPGTRCEWLASKHGRSAAAV